MASPTLQFYRGSTMLYELYQEKNYSERDDSIEQTVLYMGTEQQCIDARKVIIKEIENVGRLTDNFADIHEPAQNGNNNGQFVAIHLGTPDELHMKFIVGIH